MSKGKVSLDAFQDMLVKHDWFYILSDDHRVYLKGKKADEHIRELINSGPEYREAYEKFARCSMPGGRL